MQPVGSVNVLTVNSFVQNNIVISDVDVALLTCNGK